jgi:dATP pyrophosphohydrolase
MRFPYQVLIFPFVKKKNKYFYAIFKRADLGVWQGIAGGGEEGEKPLETAKREAYEEAGIDKKSRYVRLSAISTTPTVKICGFKWGKDIIMVPEFTFGVELFSQTLKIAREHTEVIWCGIEEALKKLEWDSNKAALWELNYRLRKGGFRGVKKNIKTINKFL